MHMSGTVSGEREGEREGCVCEMHACICSDVNLIEDPKDQKMIQKWGEKVIKKEKEKWDDVYLELLLSFRIAR